LNYSGDALTKTMTNWAKSCQIVMEYAMA